jgi:hypothetical protein
MTLDFVSFSLNFQFEHLIRFLLNSWICAPSIELKDMILCWTHHNLAFSLLGGNSLVRTTFLTKSFFGYFLIYSTTWSFTWFLSNHKFEFWTWFALSFPIEKIIPSTFRLFTVTIFLEYSVNTADLLIASEITPHTSGILWAFSTFSFLWNLLAIWALWKNTISPAFIGDIEHWALWACTVKDNDFIVFTVWVNTSLSVRTTHLIVIAIYTIAITVFLHSLSTFKWLYWLFWRLNFCFRFRFLVLYLTFIINITFNLLDFFYGIFFNHFFFLSFNFRFLLFGLKFACHRNKLICHFIANEEVFFCNFTLLIWFEPFEWILRCRFLDLVFELFLDAFRVASYIQSFTWA